MPVETDDVAEEAEVEAAAVADPFADPFDPWSGGVRVCPPDKWECSVAQGGCSYFNPKTLFYCDMCSKARPDLAAVRF
jgi:hypothetical protein